MLIIRLFESIISRLAMSELSTFLLVSLAEQAGLSLVLSETKRSINLWVSHLYYVSYVLKDRLRCHDSTKIPRLLLIALRSY